jgi:hypothetical protein
VASNAEGVIFPQGRRASGKGVKLQGTVKAVSFSEAGSHRDSSGFEKTDESLAREVHAELLADHRKDAARFANRIVRLGLPEDLRWIASNAGSMSRYGTETFPVRFKSRREIY